MERPRWVEECSDKKLPKFATVSTKGAKPDRAKLLKNALEPAHPTSAANNVAPDLHPPHAGASGPGQARDCSKSDNPMRANANANNGEPTHAGDLSEGNSSR